MFNQISRIKLYFHVKIGRLIAQRETELTYHNNQFKDHGLKFFLKMFGKSWNFFLKSTL